MESLDLIAQTNFESTSPLLTKPADSSVFSIAPRLIAEVHTEHKTERLQVNGNTIFRSVSQSNELNEKFSIVSYNVADLSRGTAFQGPEGHDDICLYFANEKYVGSYSTCGCGATTYVWNRTSGHPICKLDSSLRFAQSDDKLVVWKGYKTGLQLWDLAQGRLIRALENLDEPYGFPLIDGEFIFCGQPDGTIGCWSATDGSFIKTIGEEKAKAQIKGLCINENVLIAVDTSSIRIFDKTSGQLLKEIARPLPGDERSPLNKFSYKNDLLEMSTYNRVELWNVAEGRCIYSSSELCLSGSDDDFFYFANPRSEIEIRSRSDGSLKATLEGHRSDRPMYIKCLSVGQYLISGSKDGLKIWNKETGDLAAVLTDKPVDHVVVHQQRVVAQVGDTLTMWDLSAS